MCMITDVAWSQEWAKYDVYGVGLVLVRILFQPLWDGEGWVEFRDG